MEMPGFTICRHYMNHLLVCAISLFGSQAVFEKIVSGNEPEIIVDTSDVADHIQVLADDAFEGREGGRRGGRAASSYIEQEIMPLGLIPAGCTKYSKVPIWAHGWNRPAVGPLHKAPPRSV